MAVNKFDYAAQKVAAARSSLMAPHPNGEAVGYASAFFECSLGLQDLELNDFDDSARGWVRTIQNTMDTSGLVDPSGRGTFTIKAERLTLEEKFDFSRAIDDLASWLDDQAG